MHIQSQGKKYLPADIRLMQFQGVTEDQYPLGLEFLTFDYPEQPAASVNIDAQTEAKNPVFEKFNRILNKFAEKSFKEDICVVDTPNLSSALGILQQQLSNNGSTDVSLTIMAQQSMSSTCLFSCQYQQQTQSTVEKTSMSSEISKRLEICSMFN